MPHIQYGMAMYTSNDVYIGINTRCLVTTLAIWTWRILPNLRIFRLAKALQWSNAPNRQTHSNFTNVLNFVKLYRKHESRQNYVKSSRAQIFPNVRSSSKSQKPIEILGLMEACEILRIHRNHFNLQISPNSLEFMEICELHQNTKKSSKSMKCIEINKIHWNPCECLKRMEGLKRKSRKPKFSLLHSCTYGASEPTQYVRELVARRNRAQIQEIVQSLHSAK